MPRDGTDSPPPPTRSDRRGRLRRAQRLRRRRDFERLRREGRWYVGETLRFRFVPNGVGVARLAIAAPRRVLGGAVARNRFKRWIREAFRMRAASLPVLDVLVTPRRGRRPDSLREIEADFERFQRALSEGGAGA